MSRRKPVLHRFTRADVERGARVMGPRSSFAKALAKADEHAIRGEPVEFFDDLTNGVLLVVPVTLLALQEEP